MKSFILAAALLSAPFNLQANQDTTSRMQFSTEEAEAPPHGLLPYLGASGGYTGYENDRSVMGTPASLKLLGSYYDGGFGVYDLGYGFANQQFTEDEAIDTARTEGSLELAARYAFASRWQAGVVANHIFAMGGAYTAEQGDAQFVGLQVLREFNMTSAWLARVGARWQALTNNTSQDVNMFLVDLQIGWNPSARKPSVRAASESSPVAAPARPVASVEPAPILNELSYSALAGDDIQFRTADANLSPADEQKLSRLARAIQENPGMVERIEIRGFTDSSGNAAINRRLSEQRANNVRSVLERNGLTNVDVVAVGEGEASSGEILDSDRRAELIFKGVKDADALRSALE